MIGLRERASFAAGDLGFNFVWQSLELYLLYFYVGVLGLSPAAASAIFLAGALADWLVDPLVGALADRAAGRVPLRLWTAAGGIAASAVLVVAFAEPRLPPLPRLAYAALAHLALRAAYSVGNIPYGALTARISPRPADQVALTGARMQGAATGGLIAALVYALLPARDSRGDADFATGAMLLAVLSLPAFAATWAGVRERVVPAAGPRPDLAGFVRLLRGSAALRRVLATILVAGLSMTVLNKSILFVFDRLGATRLGYVAAAVPPLSLLLTTPLWLALARRFGCSATLTGAAVLNAGAVAALALAGTAPGLVFAAVALGLIAGNGMSVMFWALLPGAIDAIERGGDPCAARVFALGGMARKLAQAVAPQFVALGLALSAGRTALPGVVAAALLTLVVVALYPPRDA